MGFPIRIPLHIMIEARRLAKDVVKNEIRRNGMKISSISPSEITAAANAKVTSDYKFLYLAQLNLPKMDV